MTTAIFTGELSRKNNFIKPLLISFSFFVLEIILVQFHEVWTDEVHSWAIAMTSHSIGELVYNSRFEGHPKLWYIILYVLQFFTHHIFYMKVLHVFIAATAVFVFCYFSPFNIWQNVLMCSGYFFAYEYSIISRNYGIGLLLLFLCAGIYNKYKGNKILLLSVLFFLLFQTNVYEVIIGVPFYIYVIYNLYKSNSVKHKYLAISGTVVLAGVMISALGMNPPTRTAFTVLHTGISFYDCSHALATIFVSWFPIPEITPDFWCSNFLNGLSEHVYIQALLSIILLVLATLLFKSKRSLAALFYVGTAGILLFTYILNFGWLRHHGHLYILFILCYWLYAADNKANNYIIKDRLSTGLEKYFVTCILVAQTVASVFANSMDVKYTFSNNEGVAKYLKDNSLDTLPIAGFDDYSVSGVAGIMNKDVYFLLFRYWGQWILLDSNFKHTVNFSPEDLLFRTIPIVNENKKDAIVLLSNLAFVPSFSNWHLDTSFHGSVVGEDFLIYRVKYVPPNADEINRNGKIMLGQGKMDDAIALFTNATRVKPGFIDAYMNLAACYDTGKHNFTMALEMIDSALKYSPNDDKILFDKGTVLADNGDSAEALIFFSRTIQANPAFYDAYLYAALCNITRHNYNAAMGYLNKLLEMDPNNRTARNMIKSCLKN